MSRIPHHSLEELHKRTEDVGRAAVMGWVGHPAVASEVAVAKPLFKVLVEPLQLPDQMAVTLVTGRFLDGTGVWPDGTEWANPFLGAPRALIEAGTRIQPVFVEALRQLAERMAAAGAPLDPLDEGVALVLAQLLLLDIDLTRPATELVDELNVWPPGWVNRELAKRGHPVPHPSRHGRTVRFRADLAAAAEEVAQRLGPDSPPIHAPYAGGRQRATRNDTQRLREALAPLVERYPSLTPTSLLALVSGQDHPALDQLRTALGAEDGWQPDQRRLERNWPKPRH